MERGGGGERHRDVFSSILLLMFLSSLPTLYSCPASLSLPPPFPLPLLQMWRASTVLMSLLEDMGAEAKLVVAVEGTSPVVFGRIIKVRATFKAP